MAKILTKISGGNTKNEAKIEMKSHAILFSLQQSISLSCHSHRNKRLRWQMGRQLLVAPQSQRGFYPLIYHPHELCPSFSTFGVSDFFQIFPDSGFDLGFRVQSSRETSNFFHGTFYILVWCLWSLRGNSSHKITSRMPIFQVSTC